MQNRESLNLLNHTSYCSSSGRAARHKALSSYSDSTRQRDERTKRTLYERYHVVEYWIIDPELETVKIFRLNNGRYDTPQELTAEQPQASLTTPLLSGFSLPLSTLFS